MRIFGRSNGGSSLVLALGLLAVAGCSGTGNGGTGDPASEPDGDVYGDGRRVPDLLGDADWYDEGDPDSLDCDEPGRRRTRLTGLTVVAVDEFDERGDGSRSGNVFAVQSPGKGGLEPYTGITLRRPGKSPPDLRLFGNEVVDISGDYVEFLGPPAGVFGSCATLPQIEGTLTYRFDGAPVEPYLLVPAVAASPDQDRFAALKGYEAMRPYIGMLVRLENVTISEIGGSSGDFTATIDVGGGIDATEQVKITNELYDITGTGPAIAAGRTFASVTGVVSYFYSFKIAPRSPADFVSATAGE